jgi:hypothetical protein
MKRTAQQIRRGVDLHQHRGPGFRGVNAFMFLATIVSAACSHGSGQPAPPAPLHSTASTPAAAATGSTEWLAERIGWFHGRCLVIANAHVNPGANVWLVLTTNPQTVAVSKIGPATNSSDICKPLLEDRADENAKPGVAFYSIEAPALQPTDMGIGLVDSPAKPVILNGVAHVDFDNRGHAAAFSSCATTEGVQFSLWDGVPYRGTPRWTGYYYLGYESSPNCPR